MKNIFGPYELHRKYNIPGKYGTISFNSIYRYDLKNNLSLVYCDRYNKYAYAIYIDEFIKRSESIFETIEDAMKAADNILIKFGAIIVDKEDIDKYNSLILLK